MITTGIPYETREEAEAAAAGYQVHGTKATVKRSIQHIKLGLASYFVFISK